MVSPGAPRSAWHLACTMWHGRSLALHRRRR
jgi:hypothetical protein